MKVVNNKKIAINTLFLYVRMLITMVVGLYTIRVILSTLGVVDYGIYNVVGGIVSMFSFINGTLTTSSQRYFSVELAKGDDGRLNKWFCLNVTAFSLLIPVFILIAETIGLWFVNNKMVIPPNRLFAANVVYQLSIIAFCVHFFSIPYNAMIIAYEKMGAFAYISIIETFARLGIVYLLMVSGGDKLIVYAILTLIISLIITSTYIIYNRIHFRTSKFKFYWNKSELSELLSFSGWHFYGTLSVVIRSQGINILLNMFFNPAINGARAIAFQIYNAVHQLSNNFFVAIKPQIYKSYAANAYDELYKLIMRSTIICSLLTSILVFPIIANTNFILELWLKEVPEYAVIFTILVLINGLVDSTNGPTTAAVLATGKIRNYELVVATLYILNLPLSYVALIFGAEPTATMAISIIMSIMVTFARAFILGKKIPLPFKSYLLLFIKISAISIVTWGIIVLTGLNHSESFLTLFLNTIMIVVLVTILYVIFVFNREDVKTAIIFVKKRVKK